MHLPIVGARGWLVRVAPRQPHLLTHLVEAVGPHTALHDDALPLWPTAADVVSEGEPRSEIGALLHPHRDGRTIVIGSTRQIWLTPEPPEERIVARVLEAAIELVPEVAEARVQSSWWGLRPLTPDERPLVGSVREGLHLATGHGSEGVILGAGTAQLVAAQLAGEPPPFDAAPFDPLRFRDRTLNVAVQSERRPARSSDSSTRSTGMREAACDRRARPSRLGGDQRVHDGLLGRLDRGAEQAESA